MPLRPFPFPLSIGTDIVNVNRFREILVKAQSNPAHLERFLRRFLTPREQNAFSERYWPQGKLDGKQLDVISRSLAGRWAAKEATIKAVSWRRLSFHDIVIVTSQPRGSLLAVILEQAASGRRVRSEAGGSERRIQQIDPSGEVSSVRDIKTQQESQVDQSAAANATSLPGKDDDLERETCQSPDINYLGFAEDAMAEEGRHDDYDEDTDPTGQIARISISHDGDYATAVCLAAEDSLEGDVGGEAAARQVS